MIIKGRAIKPTRGNIVFIRGYEENIEEKLNKKCIYVHWDMFPDNALGWIQDFLQLPGAISRKNDDSYLTAWMVHYYLTNNQHRSLDDDDFGGIGVDSEVNKWGGVQYIYIIEPIDEEDKNFKITVLNYDLTKYGEYTV